MEEDISKKFEKAGEDFGKKAEKAGKKIGKDAEKAGKEFGKKAEKWGKGLEKKFDNYEATKSGRAIGAIIGIVVNAILLYVVNKYHQDWSFLKDNFTNWLPWFNAALIVSMVGQGFLLIVNQYLISQLVAVITSGFGVYVTVRLLTGFPFDFSDINSLAWLNTFGKWFLGLIILGLIIDVITRLSKMSKYCLYKDQKKKDAKK